MIVYHKGSLWDAPKDSVFAHACNCKGVWGSGIAVEFKERFPGAFSVYETLCRQAPRRPVLGTIGAKPTRGDASYMVGDDGAVVCLFTSEGYGPDVDDVPTIVDSTRRAIAKAVRYGVDLTMPKINSGKFGVPWELTEAVLNEFPDATFHVYTGEDA